MYRFVSGFTIWLILIGGASFAEEKSEPTPGEKLFVLKVKPLLAEKCLACHGKDREKIESNLDLTSRNGMLKGGDVSTEVLVPGQAEKSRLYVATTWQDPSCEMPPKENDRLTREQTWWIRDWINAGAPWPDDAKTAAIIKADAGNQQGLIVVKTSGGLSEEWNNRKYRPEGLWSYRPVQKPEVPWDALKENQPRHPIDAFIQQRLNDAKLTPAARADSLTLLRRITYDLTGLPPTMQAVQEFEQAGADGYLAKIDELLKTPRYGEQWARHWLDVTRYGDTSGFSRDDPRPNAWRYRDYVIRSLNQDKPYDQFLIEQIAGDELDETSPEYLIAVGYLRMGPWEHTGMSVAALTRQQYLDDVTNAIGETFLGQVLRCAKCHDHKFDPIPTRDYYRIMAALAPVQLAEREVPFLEAENSKGLRELEACYDNLLKAAEAEQAAIRRKNQLAEVAWLKEQGIETNLDDLASTLKKLPKDKQPPRFVGLDYTDLGVQKVLAKRIEYFERMRLSAQPYAFSVYSGPPRVYSSNRNMMAMPAKRQGDAEPTFILTGGSLESPREEVTPGVLSATFSVGQDSASSDFESLPSATTGRRLGLARWMTSPQNPLTARVIVNRVWQNHFGGQGLVGTPNNFGITGKRPTHPELLDYLASWFIENGWSLKKLHRLILTSETYRRSSRPVDVAAIKQIDPANLLLSYYPPRRLDAEEIRDSLLMMSGELDLTMGGPGVFPEIHHEVAMQPIHVMGSVAPAWQPSLTPSERNRRTIYTNRQRNRGFPDLEAFNQPGSEASCERRDQTTVTPQAFTLLNSESSLSRALAMAKRLTASSTDPGQQIRQAFLLTYHREPTAKQLEQSLAHLERMRNYHESHPPLEMSLPKSVDRHMVEEMTGEEFSWTEPLDVYADPRFIPDVRPWHVDAATRALAEVCLVLMNSNEFLYVY